MVSVAALAAENRKIHAAENQKGHTNTLKCQELEWASTSLAVETYGNWGEVVQGTFSRLASHLAISQSRPKALAMVGIYGRLNLHLVKSIARLSLPYTNAFGLDWLMAR